MVGNESFLIVLFGRNEGFEQSENLDLVSYQRECHAKNSYKAFENEDFWLRLGHRYNIRVNQSCLFVTNSFIEDDLNSSDIKHDMKPILRFE